MRKWLCILIAGLCDSVITAIAQGTLSLDSSSAGEMLYAGVTVSQSFTFPSPAVVLANYNAVQVTFSAPSGYAWWFDASGPIQFNVSYGTPDPENDLGTEDYSFGFVPGMSSTVQSSDFSGSQLWDHSFSASGVFIFGASVEFTAVTMTLHYVPVPGWQEIDLPLSPPSQAIMEFICNGPADPSHLSMLPIPEPGLVVLAVLGGCLMVCMRASGRRFSNRL